MRSDLWRDGVRMAILAMLTVAAYSPVFHGDFVTFDDGAYVVDNEHVHGLTLDNMVWAFTTGYVANWHPLTWISHMIDFQIYGLRAWGHHLTNLLFHAANTVLLFRFLSRSTRAPWKSFMVAALFALHPLHVESVAWIAERKDVLSGFFWMLALMAYARYVEGTPSRWCPLPNYALLVLAVALGLMAKPMLVTLPCVLLLLDYWPLRGTPSERCPRNEKGVLTGEGTPSRWCPLVLEKIPLFALAAASCMITVVVQGRAGTIPTFENMPLGTRLSNLPVSYVTYIAKMVYPRYLAVFYPLPADPHPLGKVAAASAVLLAATLLALRFARRYPYGIVGWLWFLGTLVPVIGIIQVGDQAMADRYTYLPLIGLFLVIVWGVAEGTGTPSRWCPRGAAAISGGAVLLACGALTAQQTTYWRDTLTLFDHAVRVTEHNRLAHYNLGCAYLSRRDYIAAAEHFYEALQVSPNDVESMTNLGVALSALGKQDQAMRLYYTALSMKPNHVNAMVNLGAALLAKGRFEQAVTWCSDALVLEPENADAHCNLGLALLGTPCGKVSPDAAIKELSEALRYQPAHVEAMYGMAVALKAQGRFEEAARAFSRVLQLQPDHAKAREGLERISPRR